MVDAVPTPQGNRDVVTFLAEATQAGLGVGGVSGPKGKKSAKGLLLGCLGLFLMLFLLGLAFLVIMLFQNPTQNPILTALGVEPALFKNVLSLLVSFLFGLLTLASLIVTLMGAFRWFTSPALEVHRKKTALLMAASGLLFGLFSVFMWIVLFFYISQVDVSAGGSLEILSDPTETINLTAPVDIVFSAASIGSRYTREGVVAYSWDLDGDGQFDDGNGEEIRYTYSNKGKNDGIYNVGVGLVLATGKELEFGKLVTIANVRPEARFSFLPKKPRVGDEVLFDAGMSSDSDGNVSSYSWDFDGDGVSDASGKNVAWTFTVSGVVEVALTVEDNNGEQVTTSVSIAVGEVERKEVLIVATPGFIGQAPYQVVLDGSRSFVGLPILDYVWDFGDGSLGDRGRKVTHVFQKVGDYEVVLGVTDEEGNRHEGKATVQVKKQVSPPSAVIRVLGAELKDGKVRVEAPKELTFDGSGSTDRDGGVTEYRWDTDGDSVVDGFGVQVRALYTEKGEVTVTLVVVDSDGLESRSEVIVAVERANIKVEVSAEPMAGSVPLEVTFDASASTIQKGSIVSYRWNFGDGKGEVLGSAKQVHLYEQVGVYTVMVTALSAAGEEAEFPLQIVVREVELQAQFSFNPMSVKAGEKLFFDGSASIGNIQRYYWTFEDGGISRIVKPEYIFTKPGTYSVKLEVFDYQNNTSELTKQVVVK